MKNKFRVFIVLCIATLFAVPATAVDFPAREKAKYKNMKWVEIDDLYQDYLDNKVNIVDVRSKLEFETIHTKDAFHIPVAERSFEGELKKLIRKSPGKKTAFY